MAIRSDVWCASKMIAGVCTRVGSSGDVVSMIRSASNGVLELSGQGSSARKDVPLPIIRAALRLKPRVMRRGDVRLLGQPTLKEAHENHHLQQFAKV